MAAHPGSTCSKSTAAKTAKKEFPVVLKISALFAKMEDHTNKLDSESKHKR